MPAGGTNRSSRRTKRAEDDSCANSGSPCGCHARPRFSLPVCRVRVRVRPVARETVDPHAPHLPPPPKEKRRREGRRARQPATRTLTDQGTSCSAVFDQCKCKKKKNLAFSYSSSGSRFPTFFSLAAAFCVCLMLSGIMPDIMSITSDIEHCTPIVHTMNEVGIICVFLHQCPQVMRSQKKRQEKGTRRGWSADNVRDVITCRYLDGRWE